MGVGAGVGDVDALVPMNCCRRLSAEASKHSAVWPKPSTQSAQHTNDVVPSVNRAVINDCRLHPITAQMRRHGRGRCSTGALVLVTGSTSGAGESDRAGAGAAVGTGAGAGAGVRVGAGVGNVDVWALALAMSSTSVTDVSSSASSKSTQLRIVRRRRALAEFAQLKKHIIENKPEKINLGEYKKHGHKTDKELNITKGGII